MSRLFLEISSITVNNQHVTLLSIKTSSIKSFKVGEDAPQSAVGIPSAGSSAGQLKSYFEELEEKLRVKVSNLKYSKQNCRQSHTVIIIRNK